MFNFQNSISPASEAKRITDSRNANCIQAPEKLDSSGIFGFARPFFSKTGRARTRARSQDPPDCRGQQILLATRQKCENVGGGGTWSGAEKISMATSARMARTDREVYRTPGRYVRTFRQAGGLY